MSKREAWRAVGRIAMLFLLLFAVFIFLSGLIK